MAYTTMLFNRLRGLIAQSQIPTTLDANARVGVRKNSTGSTFLRRRLNLIEGTGITLTVSDDGANEEVDVTIDSSGGGGGGNQFDEDAPAYRFPTGGTFTRIAQEDPGDGSEAYMDMQGESIEIKTDDGAGKTAVVTQGQARWDLTNQDGSDYAIINVDGQFGQVTIETEKEILLNPDGGFDESRVHINAGTGLVNRNLSAAPSNPIDGQVYWDTTLVKLRVWDGSNWINLH